MDLINKRLLLRLVSATWARHVCMTASRSMFIKKRGRPLSPPPNDVLKAPLPPDQSSLTGDPLPGIKCSELGINY